MIFDDVYFMFFKSFTTIMAIVIYVLICICIALLCTQNISESDNRTVGLYFTGIFVV